MGQGVKVNLDIRRLMMKRVDMAKEVGAVSYPGRGIILGRTPDGKKACIAYFIMGRSENSRNRVFVTDGDGIRTEAYDPSKLVDPSLIIYAPVRVRDTDIIVTNGDQTDTIYNLMNEGYTFEQSLRTREFEPDAPNFTPRISGVIHFGDDVISSKNDGEVAAFTYEMSILKSNNGDPSECNRYTFSYDNPKAGEGHFIHTYQGDGDPLPSYEGEPTPVIMPTNDIDDFTDIIWRSLNEDNKVSLFTRFVDIENGDTESRIMNKNC